MRPRGSRDSVRGGTNAAKACRGRQDVAGSSPGGPPVGADAGAEGEERGAGKAPTRRRGRERGAAVGRPRRPEHDLLPAPPRGGEPPHAQDQRRQPPAQARDLDAQGADEGAGNRAPPRARGGDARPEGAAQGGYARVNRRSRPADPQDPARGERAADERPAQPVGRGLEVGGGAARADAEARARVRRRVQRSPAVQWGAELTPPRAAVPAEGVRREPVPRDRGGEDQGGPRAPRQPRQYG